MTKMRKYNNRAAKMSPQNVLEIRRLYHQEGWSQGQIARESLRLFGASIGVVQVGRIVRGESHQALPNEMPADALKLDYAHEAELDPAMLKRLQEELNAGGALDEEPIESTEDILNRRAARAVLKEDSIEPSSATEPPAPRDESGVDR